MLKYQGWDGVAVTSGCHRKGQLSHKKDKNLMSAKTTFENIGKKINRVIN
jgi:hypothetical protein